MRPVLAVLAFAGAAAVGCGGAEDDRDPVWSYIAPALMQPNCATSSCHSEAAAVAGLDFSTAERGYKSLLALKLPLREMDAPAKARPLVTPFVPTESRLVNMLHADGARRMPPDRPLAAADIALVERWILNGAKDD